MSLQKSHTHLILCPTKDGLLTDDEVLARYPGLRPLLEMEPPWEFGEIIGSLIGGKRERYWRVDTLSISAEDWTVARRRPSRR